MPHFCAGTRKYRSKFNARLQIVTKEDWSLFSAGATAWNRRSAHGPPGYTDKGFALNEVQQDPHRTGRKLGLLTWGILPILLNSTCIDTVGCQPCDSLVGHRQLGAGGELIPLCSKHRSRRVPVVSGLGPRCYAQLAILRVKSLPAAHPVWSDGHGRASSLQGPLQSSLQVPPLGTAHRTRRRVQRLHDKKTSRPQPVSAFSSITGPGNLSRWALSPANQSFQLVLVLPVPTGLTYRSRPMTATLLRLTIPIKVRHCNLRRFLKQLPKPS